MTPDYSVPVASAWKISSMMIGRTSPTFELLQFCAFLAPDGIPDALVQFGAPALGPGLGTATENEIALDQIIRVLRTYSMLDREDDRGTEMTRLSLHRMLQGILLDEMDEPTRQLWAERAVRALLLTLPKISRPTLQVHIQQYLDRIVQWQLPVPEAEKLRAYLLYVSGI